MNKALVYAAGQGELATVKALLAQEKDIDDVYATRETALQCVALFSQTEVIRLLLEAGANADPRCRREAGNAARAISTSRRRGEVGLPKQNSTSASKQIKVKPE